MENSQAAYALEAVAQLGDTLPEVMLSLKKSILEKELVHLKLEQEMIQTYIDYLYSLGALTQNPFKNYLEK